MSFKIDHTAQDIALRRYVLPECLHVPIAAVDEEAVTTYIGNITQVLSKGVPKKALLVSAKESPAIDDRLPIWKIDGAEMLHRRIQGSLAVGDLRFGDDSCLLDVP